MRRTSFLAIGLLLTAAPAFTQSSQTDSQTLQSLLQEVHQLRIDLQSTTVTVERAQILLFRLNLQQATVVRAKNQLDTAHSRVIDLQTNRKAMESQNKVFEDMKEHSQNPTERKQAEDMLARFKTRLESMPAEEQQAQLKEIEADQLFHTEQSKLEALQSDLERLDKTLENLIRRQ